MGEKIWDIFFAGVCVLAIATFLGGTIYAAVIQDISNAKRKDLRADMDIVVHSIEAINSRPDEGEKDLKVETVEGYAVITVGGEVESDRVPLSDGVTIETIEAVNTVERYILHGTTERLKKENSDPEVYASYDD